MIQIPDTAIFLGNAGDLWDISSVLAHGVEAIIDLAVEEPIPKMPPVITYCRFALTDHGENSEPLVRAAVTSAATLIAGGVLTAVCCNAGLNRSPSIAAAAMSVAFQSEPASELRRIAELKSIDVNPALWSQVVRACRT